MMFETWTPAVFSLMNSSSAIWRLVRPRATKPRTSRSRAVSRSAATAGSSSRPASGRPHRARSARRARSAHAPRAPSLRGQAGPHRAGSAVSSDAAQRVGARDRGCPAPRDAPRPRASARRRRRTGARARPTTSRAPPSGPGRVDGGGASPPPRDSTSHAADSGAKAGRCGHDVGVPRPDRLEERVTGVDRGSAPGQATGERGRARRRRRSPGAPTA